MPLLIVHISRNGEQLSIMIRLIRSRLPPCKTAHNKSIILRRLCVFKNDRRVNYYKIVIKKAVDKPVYLCYIFPENVLDYCLGGI